jgi:cyanate permease
MIDLTNRWVVLGLLFLVGLTAPLQFQAVAALAPFLIAQAGLTYTDIGVLSGLYMLPGIFLAAPSGMLSAWIGDRLTLVLGIALMALSGIAFALTDSYAVMAASRIVGGAGAVAVTVLLPKVVTDWFMGKEIATGMAIIASSVGFGIGLSMAALPAIAAPSSWQTAMLTTAGLSLLAILLLLAVFRDSSPDCAPGKAKPATPVLLWSISGRELVLSSLAGTGRGLFSAGYFVFMSFLPPLLIARGMAPVEAGLLTSIAALASLVSVPLGGWLSDRTGKTDWFIIGGSLTTTLTCVLVPYVAPALLWVLLFGFLRGGCTGGLMSLPSQVLRPESRSTGFAVVSGVYFVCMSAFPAAAGWLLDATGDTAAPMWFAGLLWLSITVLLIAFRILQRRWKEPEVGVA